MLKKIAIILLCLGSHCSYAWNLNFNGLIYGILYNGARLVRSNSEILEQPGISKKELNGPIFIAPVGSLQFYNTISLKFTIGALLPRAGEGFDINTPEERDNHRNDYMANLMFKGVKSLKLSNQVIPKVMLHLEGGAWWFGSKEKSFFNHEEKLGPDEISKRKLECRAQCAWGLAGGIGASIPVMRRVTLDVIGLYHIPAGENIEKEKHNRALQGKFWTLKVGFNIKIV